MVMMLFSFLEKEIETNKMHANSEMYSLYSAFIHIHANRVRRNVWCACGLVHLNCK